MDQLHAADSARSCQAAQQALMGARAAIEQLLSPGGSKDAEDLMADSLGREHCFEAWPAA